MTDQRKNHLFGFTFDVSVKWLIVIIVMGLVQFGVFWEQFRQVGSDIAEIKTALKDGVNMTHTLLLNDVQQDSRITEIERRLNARDARELRTNGSRP